MNPFVESQELIHDVTALKTRLDQDGYLFIRHLIPRNTIENVRQQTLAPAKTAGWLKDGTPVSKAIANPDAACVDPDRAYLEVLRQQLVLEDLHALKHHPAIVSLFESLFGESVLVHALAIPRNIFPQRSDFTTPPHQDYVHIQGSTSTYAIWLPLGDVPLKMGGLSIASGSHRAGVRAFKVSSGAGGMECSESFEGSWVGGDFAAGDALIFHSLAVHRGLPNQTDRLRQSLDCRYSPASEPVMEISLRPYADLFTWDEVYANWQSTRYQHYWNALSPNIVPIDRQYYEVRDEMAFDLAEKGDPSARAALMRIIQRDPDPNKRSRATKLVDELAAFPAG